MLKRKLDILHNIRLYNENKEKRMREELTIPPNIYALSRKMSTPVVGLRCLADEEVRHARAYLERDLHPAELRYDAFNTIARTRDCDPMLDYFQSVLEKNYECRFIRRKNLANKTLPHLRSIWIEDRRRIHQLSLSLSCIKHFDETIQRSFLMDDLLEKADSKNVFLREISKNVADDVYGRDWLRRADNGKFFERVCPIQFNVFAPYLITRAHLVLPQDVDEILSDLNTKLDKCQNFSVFELGTSFPTYLRQVISLVSVLLSYLSSLLFSPYYPAALDFIHGFVDDASIINDDDWESVSGAILEQIMKRVFAKIPEGCRTATLVETLRRQTLKVFDDWQYYTIIKHALLLRLLENGAGILDFEKDVPIKPWYHMSDILRLPRDCLCFSLHLDPTDPEAQYARQTELKKVLANLGDKAPTSDTVELGNVIHEISPFLNYKILLRKTEGETVPSLEIVSEERKDWRMEEKPQTVDVVEDYRNTIINEQRPIVPAEDDDVDIDGAIAREEERNNEIDGEYNDKNELYCDAMYEYFDPYVNELNDDGRIQRHCVWGEIIFQILGEKWDGFEIVKMFQLLRFMKKNETRNMVDKMLDESSYQTSSGWIKLRGTAAAHLSLPIDDGRKKMMDVLADMDDNPAGTIAYLMSFICTDTFELLFPQKKYDQLTQIIKEFLFKRITKCCCPVNCPCSEKKVDEPLRILERLYRYETGDTETISSGRLITCMLLFEFGPDMYNQLSSYPTDRCAKVRIDEDFIFPVIFSEKPTNSCNHEYRRITDKDDLFTCLLKSLVTECINHIASYDGDDWTYTDHEPVVFYDNNFYLKKIYKEEAEYPLFKIIAVCHSLSINPKLVSSLLIEKENHSDGGLTLLENRIFNFNSLKDFVKTSSWFIKNMMRYDNDDCEDDRQYDQDERSIFRKMERNTWLIQLPSELTRRWTDSDVNFLHKLMHECAMRNIASKSRLFKKFLKKVVYFFPDIITINE